MCLHRVCPVVLGLILLGQTAQAGQDPGQPPLPGANPQEVQLFKSIPWQRGPCLAKMRNIGQVQVPEGFMFTDASGCATIMQLTRNLPGPQDMGLLCPVTFNPTQLGNRDWFLVFVWENIGYVKDDEKADLDADAIFKSMQDGQRQQNALRAQQNLPALTLVGWQEPPHYDPQSSHLSWGLRLSSMAPGVPGGETINYSSRLLGRGGVMSVELVIAPELLDRELPTYKKIIAGYSFQPGQTYAEWKTGDKVAAVGLTALISGGAVAVAAKSGLLGKLGKFIIYIVVAIAGGISALFKKIFGRRSARSA